MGWEKIFLKLAKPWQEIRVELAYGFFDTQ